MNDEKLHKVLATRGLGSRRLMEQWIRDGRITVNGEVAQIGLRVTPTARILLDGKPLNPKGEEPAAAVTRVLIYNKPTGEITTRNDPEGRPTIFSSLPPLKGGRWITIGRLDMNTMGLLLVTNNGELAHRLMHPSYTVERTYAVRVMGEVDLAMLQRLKSGVMLDDGMAHFDSITVAEGGDGANHWFHVTLHEGKNREVRRLWESQGVMVNRLIRIKYATVVLPRWLRIGHWHELKGGEIQQLAQQVQLTCETEVREPPATPAESRRPRAAVATRRPVRGREEEASPAAAPRRRREPPPTPFGARPRRERRSPR